MQANENQTSLLQKLTRRNKLNQIAIAKFIKKINKCYHQGTMLTSPLDFPPLMKHEKSIQKRKLRYSSKLSVCQGFNMQPIALCDTSHQNDPIQQKMLQQLSIQKLGHQNIRDRSERSIKKQSINRLLFKQQARKPLFLKNYLLELTENTKQSSIHQKYKQKMKVKKQRLFFPKVAPESKAFREIQGNELRCQSLANLQKYNFKLRVA